MIKRVITAIRMTPFITAVLLTILATLLSHGAASEELLGIVSDLGAAPGTLSIEGIDYRLTKDTYWYDTWDEDQRPIPLALSDLRVGDRVMVEADGTVLTSVQLMGRVGADGVLRDIETPM
jgi:hypothetical protein